MEIRKVALYGAGAIGAYFIWGLSKKLGDNLMIVAKGERADRLRKQGMVINGEHFALNVVEPSDAKAADLLLISVKFGALQDSLPDIAEIVSDHTTVLSLLNGVETEQIIGKEIGMKHMLGSFMKIAAERDGNSVVFNPEVTPGLYYGELKQDGKIIGKTERVEAVEKLLQDTKMHYHAQEDIGLDMWYKFALNVSQNLPQAILGIGFGGYGDSEHVNALRLGLRHEVTQIAAANGYDIANPAANESSKTVATKKARYSTLQDLDAGRHTEIDLFAGAMMRQGKAHGIPTPYSEFAFHAIKALEEKNDGLFRYE